MAFEQLIESFDFDDCEKFIEMLSSTKMPDNAVSIALDTCIPFVVEAVLSNGGKPSSDDVNASLYDLTLLSMIIEHGGKPDDKTLDIAIIDNNNCILDSYFYDVIDPKPCEWLDDEDLRRSYDIYFRRLTTVLDAGALASSNSLQFIMSKTNEPKIIDRVRKSCA